MTRRAFIALERPIGTVDRMLGHPFSNADLALDRAAFSLFFSLVWFMTITHNPDAQIADAHLRDEAFGG
jgi:hypothetical protein